MPFHSDKKKSYDSIEAFSDSYFKESEKNENNHEYDYVMNKMFCDECQDERIEVNHTIAEVNQLKTKEHIFVEYFKTDKGSWKNLCGREGYVFLCRKHKIKVHEIIICMN